jgi:hypothetical protein
MLYGNFLIIVVSHRLQPICLFDASAAEAVFPHRLKVDMSGIAMFAEASMLAASAL